MAVQGILNTMEISVSPTRDLMLCRLEAQLKAKIREKGRVSPRKVLQIYARRFCFRLLSKRLKQTDSSIIRGAAGNRFCWFDLGKDEIGRDVMTELVKYVQLLESRGLRIHTVVVNGSRAKERHKPHSDVDLLVITESPPEGLRRLLYFSDWPIVIGTEVIASTRREFLRWLEQLSLLALDSMYYGKVVLDDGFWSAARARFDGIERTYQLDREQLKERLRIV